METWVLAITSRKNAVDTAETNFVSEVLKVSGSAAVTHIMGTLSFYCVMIFSLLLVKGGQADLYGSTPPPPPDAVSGKSFPQSVFCNDPTSKCFGAQVSCPSQCPIFKPSNSKDKACFVDCNSKNCEALCKSMYSLSREHVCMQVLKEVI